MSVLYKASKIVVGENLELIENASILVKDGKIIKILSNSEVDDFGFEYELVDFGQKTIIPGMIDCHNHLALDTRLDNHLVRMNDSECEQTIRAIKTMKDDLLSGVTTARCLGDRYYIDVTCKKAQLEGRIMGPKLIVSGIGMRASHGHGYVGLPHCGKEEFRKTARENIAKGVDFLKVFMTKVINATPYIYHFLTLDELKVVVEEAKSVGITTACHCSGGQGLDDCITAGIDCLEHVYYISDEQIKRVKEADMWVVYTPSYALNNELLFKFSPKDREGSLQEKEIIKGCLENSIKGKLKFGIGTDGIHQGLAQEAIYISELGANNRDVLAGITTNAAKICGISSYRGAISEGLDADLVVLEGNPLEDISALKQVFSVIQSGEIIR
ncbi:amidohydrolase family protein [Youngiibacter multivorans]|uniref:Imidazolonepropionase-like amidohydrolase n=1 Tax=Youngiibacter multivorans TaxID=937251 RepID=A0ABS4G7Y2_9CLOT|nr:amidohydrolase family protein [Youngiibacter multivorans]MBP1920656.1 imidazolonepropionase-like amidohydrolase [Youngiibacter multivorans]